MHRRKAPSHFLTARNTARHAAGRNASGTSWRPAGLTTTISRTTTGIGMPHARSPTRGRRRVRSDGYRLRARVGCGTPGGALACVRSAATRGSTAHSSAAPRLQPTTGPGLRRSQVGPPQQVAIRRLVRLRAVTRHAGARSSTRAISGLCARAYHISPMPFPSP